MFALNEVFLAGTLAKESDDQRPGHRRAGDEYPAVHYRGTRGTRLPHLIDIEAWGKTAEVLAELHEGDACVLKGRLKWKSWEKDGKKQGTLVVAAWSVQVLEAPEAHAATAPGT